MTHNKRVQMSQALILLHKVLAIEEANYGALPGRALRHIKVAIAVIKKDPMMQKERNKK